MTVKIYTNPTLADIFAVCNDMRADEREQYTASSGEPYDAQRFAAHLTLVTDPKWLFCVDETPIVVCGYTRLRPGVWQDWMVSTDQAWKAPNHIGVTRLSRKIMDAMFENGAHRLQCVSLASRIEAHKWYSTLDLTLEGPLEGYGANGEDMLLFKRVKKHGE